MTAPVTTQPPAIILVRPQLGENIGKAARAMLNFGLTDLRLVTPRDGWPNPSAGPAAAGADSVLDQARVFTTTADALADCSLVLATTVRRRDLVKPVVNPQQAAQLTHAEPGKVGIIFGAERAGLSTDDVALADHILTVPINPDFGSLNLAQAVILVAYEWSKAQSLVQPPASDLDPPASSGERDGMIGMVIETLDRSGYFFPEDRRQATEYSLRTLFTKPRWSSKEVQMFRGIIRTIETPRQRSRRAHNPGD